MRTLHIEPPYDKGHYWHLSFGQVARISFDEALTLRALGVPFEDIETQKNWNELKKFVSTKRVMSLIQAAAQAAEIEERNAPNCDFF